ncbi:MAG: hypothetical protein GKR99_14040 [Rhodobacteraceae bacterium]|nr:hypothetical protein [Paracoccaceae bacterium]
MAQTMNPTFALEIAPDTLTLSHRRFGAWHSLGTVRRDDPRCPQRMDELRRTADWLEPNSIRTAVVVASSQVMFLTVALPSNSRGNKRREIREALKTATPFPVEDIEFDFVSEDGGARVAIVAKTALAEAIAVHFKLNPVRFAAHPSARDFNGEPDFGPTDYAAHVQELQMKSPMRKKPNPQGGNRRSASQQRPEAAAPAQMPLGNPPADAPPASAPAAAMSAPQASAPRATPKPAAQPTAPQPAPSANPLSSLATPPLTFASRRGPSVELRATKREAPSVSAPGAVLPTFTSAARKAQTKQEPKLSGAATAPRTKPAATPAQAAPAADAPRAEHILDDLPPMAHLEGRARGDAGPAQAPRQARPQPTPPAGSVPTDAPDMRQPRNDPRAATPRGDTQQAAPRRAKATPVARAPEQAAGQTPNQPPNRTPDAGPTPRFGQGRRPAPGPQRTADAPPPRRRAAPQNAGPQHAGQHPDQHQARQSAPRPAPGAEFVARQRPPEGNAQFQRAQPDPRRRGEQQPMDPRDPRAQGRQPQPHAAAYGADSSPYPGAGHPAQGAMTGGDQGVATAAAASLTPDAPGAEKGRGILGTRLARRQLSETEQMTVFGAREADEGRRVPIMPLAAAIGALLLIAGGVWGAYYMLVSGDDIAGTTGDQPPSVELALADAAAGLPARGSEAPVPRPASIAGLAPVDLGNGGTELASADPNSAGDTTPAVDPIAAATAAAMASDNPPPARPGDQPTEKSDDIVIASVDHRIPAEDAIAPPLARLLVEDEAPVPLATPAPFGTDYEFGEDGFVVATKDGAVTPDGVIVFAGQPTKVPARNPQIIAAVAGAATAIAVQTALEDDPQPRARPASLLAQPTDGAEAASQPADGTVQTAAADAADLEAAVSDTLAQVADADNAASAEDTSTTPEAQFSSTSLIPQARPASLVQRVAQARATVAASAPSAPAQPTQQTSATPAAAPATANPSIPTRASVARTATETDAITLSRLNLIGVYGSPSDRRALLRLPSGRYVKVKVGDRIDGGRVAQIGTGDLQYVKDGRTVTLAMPRG